MYMLRRGAAACAALLGAALVTPYGAHADVTTESVTTLDVSIVKAHGTTTEYTTADKQRSDTALQCEGLLSLVCGNAQAGEIIRLDRNVTWTLDPKKKEYREAPFPTAAERQAALQQVQAMTEKLKQCPVAKNTAAAPDTSKCQMSPPKIESRQTDRHATFLGHDTRLSQLALSSSCKDPSSGDECDVLITVDAWLSQDQIAGLDERGAFRKAYAQRLGLDEASPLVAKQLSQLLAPYKDNLKELSARAADFKGYPLKTTARIAFGGLHCSAVQSQQGGAGASNPVSDASQAAGDAATSSAASAAGSAAGAAASNAAGNSAAGSVLGSAASAFGSKLVSGLFSKKKAEPAAAAPGDTSASLPPGMIQAAELSVETKSISNAAVPASEFDIPADWKLLSAPKGGAASKEVSCPQS